MAETKLYQNQCLKNDHLNLQHKPAMPSKAIAATINFFIQYLPIYWLISKQRNLAQDSSRRGQVFL